MLSKDKERKTSFLNLFKMNLNGLLYMLLCGYVWQYNNSVNDDVIVVLMNVFIIIDAHYPYLSR